MNTSTSDTTFAKALRAERKRVDLTQAQLADRIGTSQQNIAGMERGLSLPRPELFDRMVEFFGTDSVIAALPPRRDLLLATEAIGEASTSASLSAFRRRQESLRHTVMYSEPEVPGMKVSKVRADRNSDLKALLPPELRDNVEKVLMVYDTKYPVDYLSEKLCVEIKSPASLPSVINAARSAMQQLHVYRSILKQQYKDSTPPTPVLLLVHGGMNVWLSPDNNPRGKTVVVEAGIMGIRVVFVDTLEQAAHFVKTSEERAYQPSTEELGIDEDY